MFLRVQRSPALMLLMICTIIALIIVAVVAVNARLVHRSIVVYETDLVRIEMRCNEFLAFVEEAQNCNEAHLLLSDFVVADLLEQLKVTVYDKRDGQRVADISIEYWSLDCDPICGGFGRGFYLPDGSLFLNVVDGF